MRSQTTVILAKNITDEQFAQIYIMSFCYSRLYIIIYRPKNTRMDIKRDKAQFGYIVSPGNNPAAIENALKKRNIWQSLSQEKELLSASFLWRQLNYSSKVYDDFEQMMKTNPNRPVPNHLSLGLAEPFRVQSRNYNEIRPSKNSEILLQS
jgi:hypothetical protein